MEKISMNPSLFSHGYVVTHQLLGLLLYPGIPERLESLWILHFYLYVGKGFIRLFHVPLGGSLLFKLPPQSKVLTIFD